MYAKKTILSGAEGRGYRGKKKNAVNSLRRVSPEGVGEQKRSRRTWKMCQQKVSPRGLQRMFSMHGRKSARGKRLLTKGQKVGRHQRVYGSEKIGGEGKNNETVGERMEKAIPGARNPVHHKGNRSATIGKKWRVVRKGAFVKMLGGHECTGGGNWRAAKSRKIIRPGEEGQRAGKDSPGDLINGAVQGSIY